MAERSGESMPDNAAQAVGQQMRVPKMAELIARHLRRQIVRGDLAEGDALPSEAELMTQFNVSRPTLREGFRILESESLITVRRGAHGGARVQTPRPELAARYTALILQHSGTTLDDLYDARTIMEPPCAAHLAKHRTPATLARLRDALAEHDAVDDPVTSVRTHVAFHTLLVDLTGNHTMRLLMSLVENIIDKANQAQVETTAGTPTHVRASRKGHAAHHRLVDLIEARDPTAAEELWRTHLTEARDYLIRPDVTTVLDLVG